MTVFQNNIKIEDLKAVTKLLHPDLPSGWEDRFGWYRKYTWVCVSFRVKGYGQIDFAIDNYHQTEFVLYGPRVAKWEMQRELSNGGIDWNIWRFTCDKLSRENEIIDKLPKEPAIIEAQNYIKSRYQLPSVKEFHKIYYED